MDNGANPDRRRVLKSVAALGGLAALGGSYAIGANPPATTTTLSPATAMTGAAKGWFDVTRFGAKGDGTSPDTGAISRAIDAAGQAGGGVVWFPAGTYCSTPNSLSRIRSRWWVRGGRRAT